MFKRKFRKFCTIDNGVFSYILKVDKQEICFSSGIAADYFASHYRKLGYTIIRTNTYKQEMEKNGRNRKA